MKPTKIAILILLTLAGNLYGAKTRLKDILTVKGVRENPLIGYGLVIGLNGTGDGGGEITTSSLLRMFNKLGLNPQQEISSKNVAAVIVTAKLPPFSRIGQKIDISVSSIGDAGSLAGGVLLVTPLKSGDEKIYAVASGNISIGGLEQGAHFATTARIPNGAVVEEELELNFSDKKSLRLNLKISDFTTAARVERVINEELGGKFAIARDATTIDLIVPTHYQKKVVPLMAIIENFTVNTDTVAKIVINERTGTVVAGGDVRLKPVAISHNELTIQIKGGDGGEEGAKPSSLYMLDKGTTLNDLVSALNALGVKPEDLISIFQALKVNGSLIGELEFM
ncbi:MAG: flagellar basal body P-ring protein FlgI [Bacteriovoracaceae bacterium]|jgi:flagellar P-ring protein FlgI|nr:flagellar basal body P-ring protein FlgI [Bacteriovoracaceae bacterium]